MIGDKMPFPLKEEEKPSLALVWFIKGLILAGLYALIALSLREIPALADAITTSGGLCGLWFFLIFMTLIICVAGNNKHVSENEDNKEEEEEETTECEKCGDYLEVYDPKPLCADCAAEAKYWHDKMNPVSKKQESTGVSNA